MPDLIGPLRAWAAATFRPQREAMRLRRDLEQACRSLARVEGERYRYQRALQAIRDAAPTASTVYRLADAALRGEGEGPCP